MCLGISIIRRAIWLSLSKYYFLTILQRQNPLTDLAISASAVPSPPPCPTASSDLIIRRMEQLVAGLQRQVDAIMHHPWRTSQRVWQRWAFWILAAVPVVVLIEVHNLIAGLLDSVRTMKLFASEIATVLRPVTQLQVGSWRQLDSRWR